MNLLFITSTRIGDAVLSTGLLDHLIRAERAADRCSVTGLAVDTVERAAVALLDRVGVARPGLVTQ